MTKIEEELVMTKTQLIAELEKIEGDPVIIIRDRFGWWNIDRVEMDNSQGAIYLAEEFGPFTSDN